MLRPSLKAVLIARKTGKKIVYSIPNTLKRFVKRGKDELDPKIHDVIYKITCLIASYIGQTKRQWVLE